MCCGAFIIVPSMSMDPLNKLANFCACMWLCSCREFVKTKIVSMNFNNICVTQKNMIFIFDDIYNFFSFDI